VELLKNRLEKKSTNREFLLTMNLDYFLSPPP